jgi:hypothetical protein
MNTGCLTPCALPVVARGSRGPGKHTGSGPLRAAAARPGQADGTSPIRSGPERLSRKSGRPVIVGMARPAHNAAPATNAPSTVSRK